MTLRACAAGGIAIGWPRRLRPTEGGLREEERDMGLMDQIKSRVTTNWKGIEPTR
jgi:hypothetical protein